MTTITPRTGAASYTTRWDSLMDTTHDTSTCHARRDRLQVQSQSASSLTWPRQGAVQTVFRKVIRRPRTKARSDGGRVTRVTQPMDIEPLSTSLRTVRQALEVNIQLLEK